MKFKRNVFLSVTAICLTAVFVLGWQISTSNGEAWAKNPGSQSSSGPNCVDQFATGNTTVGASIPINFSCAGPATPPPSTTSVPQPVRSNPFTIYFGVCDSGGVADDLLNIVFQGSTVATNSFSGTSESISIGSASVGPGSYTAFMNALTNITGPVTYSYAVSEQLSLVEGYLANNCGVDFNAPQQNNCLRNVPVFTTDTAPTDGTVEFRVQYGEYSRNEGWMLKSWSLKAGDRINNAYVTMPTPQYARVWWQPEGSSDWYLMTSQYWQGGGTIESEYGLDCGNGGIPSYHTSFAGAIHQDDVPLLKR